LRARRDALDQNGKSGLRGAGILSAPEVKEGRDLSGNDTVDGSRRRVLARGIAILAAGVAMGAAERSARADDKLAQNVVQYQETPNDGNKCSACVNWVAPNSCKIVAGTINPNGWCVAFAPKG